MRNGRTPLSQRAQDALAMLRPAINATPTGLSRQPARTTLTDAVSTDDDADEVLEELLQKGYLYEVDGELRLP